MEEVIVNEILEDKYATHGIITEKELAETCLKTIFGNKITNALIRQAKSGSEFYLIEHFYQFAVFIHFEKKSGFVIKLSDFTKNGGTLTAYLAAEAKEWEKIDRDKYLSIVQGILNDKTELAKITQKS